MRDTENDILNILHLEDNPADAELVRATLSESGLICGITLVQSRDEYRQSLMRKKFDLILSDLSLPAFNGREAFQIAREVVPETPFVYVSGTLGEDAAIECLLDGATDYVLKGKLGRLAPAVRRALKESEALESLRRVEKEKSLMMEQLRMSEARFRGVLESAPDSAVIVDSGGVIRFANRQTELILGYSQEELLGRPLEILVPDRFKPSHAKHVGSYKGDPHARPLGSGVEIFARRKDGTEFPAVIMLSPLMVDHDMSVLAMIRDISASKQAEKSLRESEELFRGIIESSPVAMTTVTPGGRIIRCNAAATKLLGYSAEELQAMSFNDFTHPDDLETGMAMLAELASGRSELVEFEKKYIRKNGQLIKALLTISAIRNDDRSMRYAITIAQDITEKWQAEESLRRSEEKYRSLVDNARDAIYTLSERAVILSLNPAFEILTGWQREEWIGRSITDLIHPDDKEKAVESFRATLRGELQDVIQYRVRNKAGGYLVGEFSVSRYTLEDGSTGVLGIARDVTSQLVLEEQLRQSQKMESIGTLAGGIAHDFNNILGIIVGYTSLSLKSVEADKVLTRNLLSIEKAAQSGVGLVRQLLLFARKQERETQSIDVNTIVSDVYRMIKETFPKVISIHLHQGGRELSVDCDQTEVHQAVLNLCVNARDAMMERGDGRLAGGTLTIATSSVQIDKVRPKQPGADRGRYVKISVADTGIGMDEETKSRIFEPFFTTKEKGKGTGLGLSTVYGIASSYGGFVEVDSKPGEGTIFTILLPAMDESQAVPAEKEKEPEIESRGNEIILVVEDEPGLRGLVYEILSARGYKVVTAEDGQQALALFTDNPDIDLVVSDIGLPKVGGIDMFRAMKGSKPEVKVILVSGFVEEHDRKRMTEAGVNRFVQKPYRPAELLSIVRQVLDGK